MSTRDRRRLFGIVGAVIVTVGVAATVLVAGSPRAPALRTVAEQPRPAPDDGVAFLRENGDETCVVLVRHGHEQTGGCVDGNPRLTVGPTGEITLRDHLDGVEVVTAVDSTTGELGERRASQPDDVEPSRYPTSETDDGRRAFTERRDGVVVVSVVESGGEIRDLAEVPAQGGYELREPVWSPGERWLLLVDSADRLLLVDADGDVDVRVLATDASRPAWMTAP